MAGGLREYSRIGNKTVVFIGGAHFSGTSALEAMLDSNEDASVRAGSHLLFSSTQRWKEHIVGCCCAVDVRIVRACVRVCSLACVLGTHPSRLAGLAAWLAGQVWMDGGVASFAYCRAIYYAIMLVVSVLLPLLLLLLLLPKPLLVFFTSLSGFSPHWPDGRRRSPLADSVSCCVCNRRPTCRPTPPGSCSPAHHSCYFLFAACLLLLPCVISVGQDQPAYPPAACVCESVRGWLCAFHHPDKRTHHTFSVVVLAGV